MTGDKYIPEFHLRQTRFTYSACGPFTKHHGRIQKFKETGNIKHIYKNELDKTCFAHDTACFNSTDLARRTISDKILKDRAYKIAINPKHCGYQRGLASMLHKFSDKNRGVKYSLFVIDIFTKYTWVKPYVLLKKENFTVALCKNG